VIQNSRRYVNRFLLLLGVLAFTAGIMLGQGGTGELTGLVTDPSGAVVANVQVNLTNSATGDKRTTVTTPAGIYRFPSLPIVGTYTLEIAPKGFKGAKIANIVISTGTTVTQDLKLELGQASEQVTVEAGAETVQTTDSSLSTLVDRNIWQSMPLQIRNQNSFIELVAGAVPQDGTNNNRGAAVNGTREGAGSYLVDGTDNNDQGQAGRGQISFYDKGGAATSISPDAIQEYRVITNSFSAEYGKGGGFITDTVLKSGTNQWHGSAYEYNRIQALTSNDWFSNNAGLRDHLVRNQFGGSLGGPIIKDKTFFYGVGELHRVRQSAPLSATSTTQQFLDFVQSGQFEQFQESDPNGFCVQNLGAACPGKLPLSSTIGPIFSSIRSIPSMNFPLANSNFTNVGNGLFTTGTNYPVPVYGTVTVVDPTSQNEARFSVKVDHRFSDKDTLSGIYLFQDATYIDKYIGGNKLIGTGYIQDGRGQNLALTWNHTFSPTILNTAKFNYLRHRTDFPAPAGAFGTPGYYTIDGIGVDLGEATGSPQFFTDNEFQYQDSISVVKGKHSLKFGGEYRRTRNGSRFFVDNFSTVLPWGIEDTLTDLGFSDQADALLNGGNHVFGGAYYISAALNPSTGLAPDVYRGFRANEVDFFAQDDWRLTNRLTLNLGLRWEYFGPPHNFKAGIDSNVYFGPNVPVPPPTPPSGVSVNPFYPGNIPFYASVATETFQTRDHEIWNKDSNNFGPRVGFAWDVLGTQKVVVRAGFGVMYDRIYNNTFENIRFNPPYYSDNQIGPLVNGVPVGPLSSPGLFAFPFTNASRAQFDNPLFSPVPNPRHMDQNIVTPYYEQYHFGVQWEFAKGWVFEPEYVGTMGHKLTGLVDLNTFNGRVACDPNNAPFGPGTPCANKGFANGVDTTRTNSGIGQDNFRNNGFDSNYHAFQAAVRKTYSYGLSLQGSYTFSKTLDETSDLFNGAAGKYVTDSMNHKADYGPADFDTKHRIVATLSYQLPFMKQNRWLGGWGVNTITSWQTGHPWSPFSSASPSPNNANNFDLNKDGNNTDRVVPINGNPGSTYLHGTPAHGTVDPTLWGKDPSTGAITYFQCPASVNDGLWCDSPARRNSVYGPHATDVDFNVTKKFTVTERTALTFQANFFDLFNHPNFLPPTAGSQGSMNIRQPDFSASRGTWGDNGGHRVIQLALRFDF